MLPGRVTTQGRVETLLEKVEPVDIARGVLQQHLHRHVPIEPLVMRPAHPPIPASPNFEVIRYWESASPIIRQRPLGAETLVQELYPVGIVVVGSTAVAHSYDSTAAEDREGERETTHGRHTVVLIKHEGKWIFIAWRGGDNPKFND